MSLVTNVILTFSLGEHDHNDDEPVRAPALEHVNAWLETNGGRGGTGPLVEVGQHVQTGKAFETCIAIGGCNYLDHEGLEQAVARAPWRHPEWVQLFMQRQHDDRFTESVLRIKARGTGKP